MYEFNSKLPGFNCRNIKFAYLPTKLTNGKWIWFKRYVEDGIVYPIPPSGYVLVVHRTYE